MGCGCKKKQTVAMPVAKPKVANNLTDKQQEKLVNEVISKINNSTK